MQTVSIHHDALYLVLGQGQGHQIVSNNWWTALEDAVIDKWHPGVACWDEDTKYQLCLDFDNPS